MDRKVLILTAQYKATGHITYGSLDANPGLKWLDVVATKVGNIGSPHYDDEGHSVIDVSERNTPWAGVLQSIIGYMGETQNPQPTAVRFLLPSHDGVVVRADFLNFRLECCPGVVRVHSFLEATQSLQHATVTGDIRKDLGQAFGAIEPSTPDLEGLDHQMAMRISFPWMLPCPSESKRIAWIQGREDIDCIERALKAAAAMEIKLVIFDEPGHWLQENDSPWAHYREAFVELDISPDSGFPQRIVDAVQSYPAAIDGIVTISDVRLSGVARACKILNLPTESPEAYDIAGDKGRTRLLEAAAGSHGGFVLGHADELPQAIQTKSLVFPMVVKPVVGWCSDCVAKVSNLEELKTAVQSASDRHAHSPKRSTGVVVEPYVDGPEVDANFILLDGEVLFHDISDDFPSPADMPGSSHKANFQETQNVMPSALPAPEQNAIRDQLRESILRQGFRSGVFHVEARVKNSSMHYTQKDCDGIMDLHPTDQSSNHDVPPPEIYLHEVNARPAGYLESVAVMLAYGVDYYAVRMLLALGESGKSRARSLCHPFGPSPQFHLSVMIIQQTRAGVMRSRDAAKEFLQGHPDMAHKVVDYYSRKKRGDVLEGPDAPVLWWIAFFSVVSRESRRDLLETVAYINSHFEYEMDPLE